MDKSNIFRKTSLDRVRSPEQLNDYLHVTSPAIWVLLAAVILLLGALFVWSAFTAYESSAAGTGTAEKGMMTISFEDENKAAGIQKGMNVTVGDAKGVISSVGRDPDGKVVAAAEINVPDGTYDVKVKYKQTQILSLLFN